MTQTNLILAPIRGQLAKWAKVLQRSADVLACLLLVLVGFIVFSVSERFPDEDAYITYVHVKSLLEGEGLTYNGIRTEGYTNLLMALAVAALAFILRLPVDVAGYLLSTAFTCLSAVLAFTLLKRGYSKNRLHSPSTYFAFLLAGGLFLNPYFVYWGFSGMENSFLTTVMMLALLAFDSNRLLLALSAASLLPLIRYDGIVPAAIIGFSCIIRDYTVNNRGRWLGIWRPWKKYCLWGIVTLVPFLISLTFRILYYGDVVPHTAYEKFINRPLDTRLLEGAVYAWNFLLSSKTLIMCTLFLLYRIAFSRRGNSTVHLMTALVITLCLHVIYIGGDVAWKPYYRFGHGIAYLAYVLYFYYLSFFSWRFAVGNAIFIMVLIVYLQPGPRPGGEGSMYSQTLFSSYALRPNYLIRSLADTRLDRKTFDGARISLFRTCRDDVYSIAGKLIGAISNEKDQLITSAAGKIPYFAGLATIDTTSLASEHIWRDLSIEEKQAIAASCTFAAFHSLDGGASIVLFPNSELKPIAYVAYSKYYYGILVGIHSIYDELTLPEKVDGRIPFYRYNVHVDGIPVIVYSDRWRDDVELPWFTDLYRQYQRKTLNIRPGDSPQEVFHPFARRNVERDVLPQNGSFEKGEVFRPDDGDETGDPANNGWGETPWGSGAHTFTYVFDAERGLVLHLEANGSGEMPGDFFIGDFDYIDRNVNDEPWLDADRRHLGLWIKQANTGQQFSIVVVTKTTASSVRLLHFQVADGTDYRSSNNLFYYLGTDAANGAWHHLELDLDAYYRQLEPGDSILEVEGFFLEGKDLYVDDIILEMAAGI